MRRDCAIRGVAPSCSSALTRANIAGSPMLYSSGTTGLPKAIVHSQGGILLEHLKKMHLHVDAGPDDRVFWFTTTGWMMWNFLVGGLMTHASIVLYVLATLVGSYLIDMALFGGILSVVIPFILTKLKLDDDQYLTLARDITRFLENPEAFKRPAPIVVPPGAPEHGQHTEEILTKVLGYSQNEVAEIEPFDHLRQVRRVNLQRLRSVGDAHLS